MMDLTSLTIAPYLYCYCYYYSSSELGMCR